MTSEPLRPASRRGLFVVYFVLAVALLVFGYQFRDQLSVVLAQVAHTVGKLGPAAPVAMVVVCGVWGTFCLPGPLMQATVGTLFSHTPWIALLVVVAGETVAQAIAFTLARYWGRESVAQRLGGQPWFIRLERQTERKGAYGVFLFRLMPFFPNALASYAFGLTSLAFLPYLVASWLGSIPKMVLYIFGTTSLVVWLRAGALTPKSVGIAILVLGMLTVLGRRWQQRVRREVNAN